MAFSDSFHPNKEAYRNPCFQREIPVPVTPRNRYLNSPQFLLQLAVWESSKEDQRQASLDHINLQKVVVEETRRGNKADNL